MKDKDLPILPKRTLATQETPNNLSETLCRFIMVEGNDAITRIRTRAFTQQVKSRDGYYHLPNSKAKAVFNMTAFRERPTN